MRKIHVTDSNERGDYDFGDSVPAFKYQFETSELAKILKSEEVLRTLSYDERAGNILTWLLNGLDAPEFGQLGAHLIGRELGYDVKIGRPTDLGCAYFQGVRQISQKRAEWITIITGQSLIFPKYEDDELEKYGGHIFHEQKTFFIGLGTLDEKFQGMISKQKENFWGRERFLEIYDKYFFDPEAGWEEFQLWLKRRAALKEEGLLVKWEFPGSDKISAESRKSLIEFRLAMLKGVRKTLAAGDDIPENKIFSNRIIKEMAERGPKRKSEFLLIKGITRRKYEKYGEPFRLAILEFRPLY